MDHRSPPPRELQLPLSAVAPVRRRRRSQRSPRQASVPAVPATAAFPVRRQSARRQIPAPPAAAGAADDDAEIAANLMLLAHIIVAQADAEAAEAAFPSAAAAAPAPAGENLRLRRLSPPLSPAAAAADEVEEKPNDAPQPIPPLAAEDHQNRSALSMDHGDAATKGSAEDCKKAAFSSQGNAGSSKGDQHGGGLTSSPLPAAGASPMQLGDDDEELEPGEIPPEKPTAGCNADRARGSILGKYPPIAASGSSAHRAAPAMTMSTGVVAARYGGMAAAQEMSAAVEEKRRREVFVGGLSRDAVEDDVRAALSAAGEITQVRMFVDRLTNQNKGYCFVAYRDAAMASRAVAELSNVKICGKPCRVAVPEGTEKPKIAQRNPTIEDYNRIYEQRQPSPTLAARSSYITSWDHHASYVVPPAAAFQAGYYYPMYHNGNVVYLPPPDHGRSEPSVRSQMGQAGSSRPDGQPHRSRN